jgi:predicted MFS family arabinose efflux permease
MTTIQERARTVAVHVPTGRAAGAQRELSPTPVLFLSLFASQGALLVLTPILPFVASDLGVSTATAGQLRSVSGLAAGFTALALGPLARRFGLRDLLAAGLMGLALGSVASAVAPTFPALVAAQVAVGAGVAVVLSAGVAAAGQWPPEPSRARTLSWTLAGQPTAWIVGMPLAGAMAGLDWRFAWLALPFASALVALLAVRSLPADAPSGLGVGIRAVLREPRVARWAAGEFLAYSAWTGTLVFSGALFVESYGGTPRVVGVLLAIGAAAYVPGGLVARRWSVRQSRGPLVVLALAMAAGVAVFGAVRPALLPSAGVFAALAFLGGARTMVGSAYGLAAAPRARVAAMSVRAAALQFGYLLGAVVGGVALSAGGYATLGFVLAALLVLAAVPHLLPGRSVMAGGDQGRPVLADGAAGTAGRSPRYHASPRRWHAGPALADAHVLVQGHQDQGRGGS